jgi:tetratricopeptide (TPR) repeat protein
MIWKRWTVALTVTFSVLAAADAFAQRGSVRVKFVDESGQPVEGVECRIELHDGGGRESTSTTKKNGELVKGGLRSGDYVVTCDKEGFRTVALPAPVSGFEQCNLGENVLYHLAPGELSEKDHARATELLDKFKLSSNKDDHQGTLNSLMELDKMLPDNPEIQFNIAATYEELKDPDHALEYYAKTTALKPDFYDAWVAVGDIHGKRKEWAEAQAALKKAIDIKATDPVLLFNYSVYAQNAGDADAAEAGYAKTLELDPKQALAHYQLGLIAVNKEQNDAAIQHFQKFLELAPNDPQAEAAKGVIEALKQKAAKPQ